MNSFPGLGWRRSTRRLVATLCVVNLLTMVNFAHAQNATTAGQSQKLYTLHIPAGSLATALVEFADGTGLQLYYTAELTQGLSSPGLEGSVTVQEGMTRLLAGTGLSYRVVNGKTVTIEKPIAGARTLGAVEVEGVQNDGFPALGGFGAGSGLNGSSDTAATEGTGSLTTNGANVASKFAQSLKDTPQAVTVITQERIQQQNLTDLTSAMNYAPGITLNITSPLDSVILSRGFEITTFQIDGGAPLDMSRGLNSYQLPVANLAEFDNVQLLRGSDALFGGAGQPGGVVSLERKRPLDHEQLILDGRVSSWNNHDVLMDATGPVGLDGHLRGRIVLDYQDRDYFYDVSHQRKPFVYGVIEADIGPDTLLRIGGSFEQQDNTGYNFHGLPRYSGGADLHLDRSTCLCANWDRSNLTSSEEFLAVEHRFSDDWKLKIDASRTTQDLDQKYGSHDGQIDAAGSGYAETEVSKISERTVQNAVSATLSGAFEFFGFKQKLSVGIDHSKSDSSSLGIYTPVSVPINVFSFNPASLDPEPSTPAGNYVTQPIQEQSGGYANVNLQFVPRLHLIGGVRVSKYDSSDLSYNLTSTGSQANPSQYIVHDSAVLTPYAAATLDLTSQLTAYASYADIYQSQSTDLDRSGKPLSPVTGATYEGGIKGSFKGGKLNTSLSVYYTEQANEGIYDPTSTDPGTLAGETTGSFCCYLAIGEVFSKGVELEASGEVLPGWQIQAGYSYNENYYGKEYGTYYGSYGDYQSQQPRHQFKAWNSYVLPDRWSRLTVGGGLRLESARFTEGSVCSVAVTATGSCPSDIFVPFNFTQSFYGVVDLRVAYKIDDHWQAALNVTNLGDTRYYATAGSSTGGNFYGEPRAFAFSIRGTF